MSRYIVDLSALSDDAKAILGSQFGLMIRPGKGDVTFQTPWNRTERAIAAYDELVAKEILSVVYGEKGRWALTYRALVDCAPAWKWANANQDKLSGWGLMVPNDERSERPPRGWALARAANTQAPAEPEAEVAAQAAGQGSGMNNPLSSPSHDQGGEG